MISRRMVLQIVSIASVISMPVSPSEPDDEVAFVGAGDISTCSNDNDEATASLLDEIEGTVFTLGDNVYDDGTVEEFETCYGATWGQHLDRTRSIPGNHEYHTEGAAGYFEYFGEAAGDRDRGYYSYDLGEWHLVALNSNCEEIGGCGVGSPQLDWLREDLVENATRCTLAYAHHPRFSSFEYGNNAGMAPIWDALNEAGVEMLLAGHEHAYERFAPMDADGELDTDFGVRQFIVGTGGASLRDVENVSPTAKSEAATPTGC